MNRRDLRRSNRRLLIPALAAVLIIGALAVYWFGFRSTDSTKTDTSAAQTFSVSGVPFTFKYPGNFAAAKTPAGFIWIAGISPNDILDVRRVANQTYSQDKLAQAMGKILRSQKGLQILGSSRDNSGPIDLVIYDVRSGSIVPLTSRLAFFSFGGAAWQLECQSQASGKAAIDAACRQALSTLSLN